MIPRKIMSQDIAGENPKAMEDHPPPSTTPPEHPQPDPIDDRIVESTFLYMQSPKPKRKSKS